MFVDWLKILADEKQAVQFRSPIVLVCEHIISSNIRLRHYTTGHHGLCQIKQRWTEASFPEQSVCKDLPRTNNAVEGWHRRFQANVGAYHPNFWKFIDILKREQSLNHINISQARAGHQPEPQHRRYQARQQPRNKEYRPRLPRQEQIAVSPWPRAQHQYVKKRFF